MKFKSLGAKVFFITSLAIICTLVAFVVLQSVFYERLYVSSQKHKINDSIINLEQQISDVTDIDSIKKIITTSTYDSDVYLMVYDHDVPIMATYDLIVKDENGNKLSFQLDNVINDADFYKLELSEGANIEIEYSSRDDNRFNMLSSIAYNGYTWKNNKARNNGPFPFGENKPPRADDVEPKNAKPELIKIKTQIIDINVPSVDFRNSSVRIDAMNATFEWLSNNQTLVQSDFNKYQSDITGCSYLTKAHKLSDDRFIFAVLSLKTVDEAVGIMKSMLLSWTLVCIIVGLFVSFIFSRLVARPISKISKITTKLKNLDFTQKCDVKGNDELAKLASNINEMSDELDSTISKLTEANEQLQRDIEHERLLEQQRKDFVAAASHELKTPLAIIRAYSEGILDGVSEQKQEKYLGVIVDETKKMDALVLDMLENAKLEAGKESLNISKHSLGNLVSRFVNLFSETAGKRNIDIKYDFDDDSNCMFDIDKLSQVIENFMSNAVKNTPNDGTISVNVKNKDEYVSFCVENSGSHIPEEELELIWDRFYKVDKSRDRSVGGTGLGLSIAKNILLLHKASYYVRNTSNGVEFGFKLTKN